jgi:hypothetical protein
VTDILIEPQNPLDLRPEGLTDLVDAIREIDPTFEIRFAAHGQRGYGVTFWEVIFIWIGGKVAETTVNRITNAAIDWAKRRFDVPNKRHRPKSITILGPDGRAVRRVKLDAKTREPEEEPPDDEGVPPRTKPPLLE